MSSSFDEKDADAGYEAGDDIRSSEKSQSGLFRRKSKGIVSRKPTMRDLEAGPGQGVTPQSRGVRAFHALHSLITTDVLL
jgi:hypothetical protein